MVASHAYAAAGTFTAGLTVTDDDGGVGAGGATVQVVDAAGAIESVIDQIDALLPGSPRACDKALEGARDDLDGNNGGAASNGALDKLQGGQLVAALVKLQAALTRLEVASGLCGLDLESLQATLALAAHAIAQKSYLDAVPQPAAFDLRGPQLALVEGWLESGADAVAVGDWSGAATAFSSRCRPRRHVLSVRRPGRAPRRRQQPAQGGQLRGLTQARGDGRGAQVDLRRQALLGPQGTGEAARLAQALVDGSAGEVDAHRSRSVRFWTSMMSCGRAASAFMAMSASRETTLT